jgi:phospholipid/cholesterol/gamma-HCH transport system substrate-binding protein
MNLELPRSAILTVVAFVAVTLALLGLILARLGALPLPGESSRTARVVFANAEGLPVQADVLVHGVRVGTVTGVGIRRSGSTMVTLTLSSEAPTLRRGATAAVGFKTPLGEPFVDLDPGHGPAHLVGLLHARATVEIDDALAFLDAAGRSNARGVLRSLSQGASSPSTGPEVSGTLAELEPATTTLSRLTGELATQRRAITSIITNGRVVLDSLSARGEELRSLTGQARDVLSALSAQHLALAATLRALPEVLHSATTTLAAARPLIKRATPLAAEVSSAASPLAGALDRLPEAIGAADTILSSTPALQRDVLPTLRLLRSLAGPAAAALKRMGPDLADLVPMARYLGPRGRTIAAWFANTATLGDHGDAKGDWARFFVLFNRATLTGRRSGAPPGNSYTKPGDAAHNRAYRPGDYPRLEPYWPALAPGR